MRAGPARSTNIRSVTAGQCGLGSDASMTPKRDPIVSTGRWKSWTTAVPRISATNGEGILVEIRGHWVRISRVPAESAAVAMLPVPKCWP